MNKLQSMKKLLLILVLGLVLASPVFAQESPTPLEGGEVQIPDPGFEEPANIDEIPPDQFYRAEIVEVKETTTEEVNGEEYTSQTIVVKFKNGDLKGQEQEIVNDGVFTVNGGDPLTKGLEIIVYRTSATGVDQFYVADVFRLPALITLVLVFFALAIVLSRWKGVTSILGLIISILVIVKFIVPQILDGKNPLMITLIGALAIALVSIYLAHGFNRKTTIALVSTLITLFIAAGMSILFVNVSNLFGLGSEEAFYIQQLGSLADLNLKGLLLGGIILGALGVLDDITTAQTAAVYELKRANSAFSVRELYTRGILIGREHISSLVNTLFLAYAGASLPLFLFFTAAAGNTQPIWATLNSEFIAEELIRTLVGSMGLMLAVPITTFIAAWYFGKREIPADAGSDSNAHIGHSH